MMNTTTPKLLALTCVALLATGCATENGMHGGFSRNAQDIAFERGEDAPPTPKTLSIMGRVLAKQGKDQQAEFVFKRVVDEHPAYLPAYVDLAELFLRTGRFHDATGILSRGLSIAPEDANLLNNMAMCHLIAGQYEQALPWFEQAVAVSPTDARFRANLAVTLGMLGRYQEAFAAYEHVLADPAEAHYNVAILCEARGDFDRAVDEYARAGLIQPLLDVKKDINRVAALRD